MPCRSIHMMGMRFALDVLFLDRMGRVIAAYPKLEPGARTAMERVALYALELPAGTVELTGTRVGDQLSWTPTQTSRDGAHAERRQTARVENLGDGISPSSAAPDIGVNP